MNHLPQKEALCHRTGFEKSCRDLVVSGACPRWRQLQGMNAQTGESMNLWDCTDNHDLMMLMSIGKATVETGAAVESARNETTDLLSRIGGSILALTAAVDKVAQEVESLRNETVEIGHAQLAQRVQAMKLLPARDA